MFSIDPRTHAIGGSGLLRVGVFVLCAIAVGLAARGWIDSLDSGEPDDDFACVEDERGTCPAWQGAIPVQLQLSGAVSGRVDFVSPFDDQEANAPGDEDLMAEDDTAEA